MARGQIGGGSGIQSRVERTCNGIRIWKEGGFESGRNDQHAEQQRWIERLNFELTLGTRPGALAAIRVTGRSEKTDAEFWPGGVNEDRCVRDGLAICGLNHAIEVGTLRLGICATRQPCHEEKSQQKADAEPAFHNLSPKITAARAKARRQVDLRPCDVSYVTRDE